MFVMFFLLIQGIFENGTIRLLVLVNFLPGCDTDP